MACAADQGPAGPPFTKEHFWRKDRPTGVLETQTRKDRHLGGNLDTTKTSPRDQVSMRNRQGASGTRSRLHVKQRGGAPPGGLPVPTYLLAVQLEPWRPPRASLPFPDTSPWQIRQCHHHMNPEPRRPHLHRQTWSRELRGRSARRDRLPDGMHQFSGSLREGRVQTHQGHPAPVQTPSPLPATAESGVPWGPAPGKPSSLPIHPGHCVGGGGVGG